MSEQNGNVGDPLSMVRKMWGNMGFNLPGMVVPTLDSSELEKRISDLKAVEGWLRMNLSMLQMTIRGLEMQNTTLTAVKAMGEMAADAADKAKQSMASRQGEASVPPPGPTPEPNGPEGQLWPWGLMQQIQEYMQRQAAAAETCEEAPAPSTTRGKSRK